MALKSKYFRIAVEGETTDGRVIERSWIEQMAQSYNPTKYTARVNCEHYRSALPDGEFRAFGYVVALKTETVKIDGEDKLALLAQIEPTADLVALNRKGQKIFTSMEVDPAFAGKDTAYLVGLAVTDSPASLGTEMLEFAAGAKVNPFASRKQKADNLFSAANEVTLEFNEEVTLLDKVKKMFSKNEQEQTLLNEDVSKAVELLASELATMQESMSKFSGNTDIPDLAKYNQALEELGELKTQFTELKTQLENTPSFKQRAPAAGGEGQNEVETDC